MCRSRSWPLRLLSCSLPLQYTKVWQDIQPSSALQVKQLSGEAAQQASKLQAAEGRVQQLTEQDEAKSRELQAARDQLQAVEAEERRLQESVARLGEDLSQLRWESRA